MKKNIFFHNSIDLSLFEEDVEITNVESDAFIDYDEQETTIIGEGIEEAEKLLKKKKRRKKLIEFFTFLKKKKKKNQKYHINKIHFIEKFNIGKKTLGKNIVIPNVYAVEYKKNFGLSNDKELLRYEIYDDQAKRLIMETNSLGNLVLSKEMENVLGKDSLKLGLSDKDKVKARQINDSLWVSSQLMTQEKIKSDEEKSKINETLDVERERYKQNPVLAKFDIAREQLAKESDIKDLLTEKDCLNILNVLLKDNYLTVEDAKTTIKIAQVSKELEERGDISSSLSEKEIKKVKEALSNNSESSIKEIKEAIEGEIGLERLPQKPH